jgi:trehalose 6-phosphate synthase/phosphatase
MDSFSEPYTRLGDGVSVEEVRAQIRALEEEHKAYGITLSGRVLHVCHHLPIVSTLSESRGVPRPPAIPLNASESCKSTPLLDIVVSDTTPRWILSPRYGHAAMVSGIRSLCTTHEQLIIGWTGDIQSLVEGENIPPCLVTDSDRAALEDALSTYQSRETDPDNFRQPTYVPVWLEDEVSHGHYGGYCKQSESLYPHNE